MHVLQDDVGPGPKGFEPRGELRKPFPDVSVVSTLGLLSKPQYSIITMGRSISVHMINAVGFMWLICPNRAAACASSPYIWLQTDSAHILWPQVAGVPLIWIMVMIMTISRCRRQRKCQCTRRSCARSSCKRGHATGATSAVLLMATLSCARRPLVGPWAGTCPAWAQGPAQAPWACLLYVFGSWPVAAAPSCHTLSDTLHF